MKKEKILEEIEKFILKQARENKIKDIFNSKEWKEIKNFFSTQTVKTDYVTDPSDVRRSLTRRARNTVGRLCCCPCFFSGRSEVLDDENGESDVMIRVMKC